MGVTVDVAYKSLNKFNEVLCGDKVELLQTENSNIMILADGMGSGVKANILATLTSKILGTMFLNGATLEDCVETIVETLGDYGTQIKDTDMLTEKEKDYINSYHRKVYETLEPLLEGHVKEWLRKECAEI